MRKFLLLAVLAAIAWFFWPDQGKRHPPGILVAEEPIQTAVAENKPWEMNGYTITPLAEFQLKARVLSRHRYWLDRESELSPIDLLLGWGPMTDQSVLDQLSLSQRSRWYEWEAGKLPIPGREIETHCANMHMVPANPEIKKQIKSARTGDIIELKGYLVAIEAADGWKWKSSLSRSDTAGGSCELVWVDAFSIVE